MKDNSYLTLHDPNSKQSNLTITKPKSCQHAIASILYLRDNYCQILLVSSSGLQKREKLVLCHISGAAYSRFVEFF